MMSRSQSIDGVNTPRHLPLLLACLTAAIVVLSVAPLWSLPARIGFNYNEGWMALTTERAMTGGVLYPAPDNFIVNNYPPLSFYIFGIAGRMVGDTIIAGRLLALLGLGLTTVLVYLSARALQVPRWSALLGMLLFLLLNLTLFSHYVGIADPQWLAQAASSAGLLVLLRQPAGRMATGALVLACLAMLLAVVIKHNVVALPLAVTIWLFWHDRRAFFRWLAISALFLTMVCATLYACYGVNLAIDVLNHKRLMSVAYYSRRPLVDMLPLIAAACLLARWRGAEPGIRLVLIAAACAFPWGLLQRTGDGVAYNAHFELLVALSITAGAALAAAREAPFRALGIRWGFPSVAVLIFVPYMGCVPYALLTAARDLHALASREKAWAELISRVAAMPGPTACEIQAACYWAGKDMQLDFFNYGQRLFTGTPAASLEQALHRHQFSQIVVEHRTLTGRKGARLPPSVRSVLNRSYRAGPVIADGLMILLPASVP